MILIILATLLSLILVYTLKSIQRPNGFPPGPVWLPLVGNTPFIRQLAKQYGGLHIVFEKLSEVYKSSVIGLKLGNELVVVALTYPMAKEVFMNEEFDGRPDTFFLRLRNMGNRLGVTCTDGPHWNEHRNFIVKHLRQAGYGKKAMDIQIQNELDELVAVIAESNQEPIAPGSMLPPSVLNVLWRFTAGQRIPRSDDRLQRLLSLLHRRSKVFDIAGGVLSQLPWIRFIAPEWSGYNLVCRLNQEFKSFFTETIKFHHETFTEENSSDDLMYAYIKEIRLQAGDAATTYTDMQLNMVILDIFIAGSLMTSLTLDMAFMMTVVRPDLQRKLFNEISSVADIGYKNKLEMPFAEAFLLEVFRFFNNAPIAGPRRALKATTLGGYEIPKNTTVLIDLQSVHMDKDYWIDPEVFRPERFLDKNGRVVNTERVIPFALGKRRCVGDSLARSCLFTFFVGVLKKFEIVLPDGEIPPSTILVPGLSLTSKPYKVIFRPRD